MKEESSDELIGFESHDLLFITICVILPAEGDFVVIKIKNAVIAYGDPVGVSSQVLKDPVDSGKRRLAVDDPLLVIEASSEYLKGSRIFEMTDAAREDQLSYRKTIFEVVQELTSKQCGHDLDWDKESFSG